MISLSFKNLSHFDRGRNTLPQYDVGHDGYLRRVELLL